MRCLYEVLNVRSDVDASALKKSYRKLALVLHPGYADRNRGEATQEAFQELQHAYEVLIDPQERAWYDAHRSSVLLSGLHRQQASHPPSTESPFSDLRFYEHQSPNAFSAFDNGPKGFYTVFRTLFQRIHSQEEAAAAGSGNDADSKAAAVPPAPEFGNLESSDSEVKVFYRYWGSFQTVKDFAWLDLHDPQAGTGRNMRRLLEAENNKARKAGKVAFVREVRNLADWVKSQDKRVQKAKERHAQKKASQAAARAEKSERARSAKQQAAERYEDAAWIKESEKEQLELLEAEQQLAAQQAASQVFECIVCDKHFKTARALQRHEAGTTHQQQLKLLKLQLQTEEALSI